MVQPNSHGNLHVIPLQLNINDSCNNGAIVASSLYVYVVHIDW